MKRLKFRILTVFILVFPLLVVAQTEKTKEVNKKYEVPLNGSFSINNKHGDIHIETWDKSIIDVQVKIIAVKGSTEKAIKYLDNVSIDISDDDKSNIKMKTSFEGNINFNLGEKLEINYNVKLPRTTSLELKNSYGNLYLDDTDAICEIKVSYGNVKIENISNTADVTLSYGNGEIESIIDGNLSINYSNIAIEKVNNISIVTNYSNTDFGEVNNVELNNKYGNISVVKANKIEGYTKYGKVSIDKLYNILEMDVLHGGGVSAGWISKGFNKVDIESKYASVKLNFEKGMSANLDADLSYCDLKNSDIEFDYSYINESGSSKQYKGRLGNGNSSASISIESAYGNVKLAYAD